MLNTTVMYAHDHEELEFVLLIIQSKFLKNFVTKFRNYGGLKCFISLLFLNS